MTSIEQNKNEFVEVCREYIELYQELEFNLNNDPALVKESVNDIEASKFKKVLKEKYSHYLDEVFFALNKAHGTSTKLKSPVKSKEVSLAKQFELLIFYITACGMAVYLEDEYFTADGEKEGILQQVKPNTSVIKAARKLYSAIENQRLEVGDWGFNLIRLGCGDPIHRQLKASSDPLRRMIREIILVSHSRLTIKNKGKGRFSPTAIVAITKIVNHKPIVDIRMIQRIQSHFEGIALNSMVPLTDNIDNLWD